MIMHKKNSRPTIISKSRDLNSTLNRRPDNDLSRSVINLENEPHLVTLKDSLKTHNAASLKKSLDRTNSQNKSGGRELKQFTKCMLKTKNRVLGADSKNSKTSKSSNQSLVKMRKDKGLVEHLNSILELVKKYPLEEMKPKLKDRVSNIQLRCNQNEKPIINRVFLILNAVLSKAETNKTSEPEYSVKHSEGDLTSIHKQSNPSVGKDTQKKQEYDNFMNLQFTADQLLNSQTEVDLSSSQCSYNSYIAQPNQYQCNTHKRLKEDVQNKLKLDLNKLKLGKTFH